MLRRSPLDQAHRELEARMVEFGGWEMPLSYPSGTLDEHRACRRGAAMFDVSHLGTVAVSGPNAYEVLQATFTNDLAKVAPGRAQYTHLLDDAGSVLDDIIVWWRAADHFDVMPNASNTERVRTALSGDGIDVRDVTGERALIAVQGPKARECLAQLSPDAAAVGRFRVATVVIGGVECVVAGTGYTGEDGVEIAVPAGDAASLWDLLRRVSVVPAGLGARDTLRLEAGLPLHGHELGPGITPLSARLGWVVGWNKPVFRGRRALLDERERGPSQLMRGLLGHSRRPIRDGAAVRIGDRVVGTVTSGNFSPMLERGIALAYLDASVTIGTAALVEVRGSELTVEVVDPPFYRS